MEELNVINSLLGGHAITLKGFNALRGNRQKIRVCEIGCGGGDNLLSIYNWCCKNNIEVTFTGIDIKAECIEFAKTKKALQNCTTWMVNDYKKITFNQPPHIIFSSLFCHHFKEEELITQLQWMRQQSSIGFFINDLQRHPLAYYSITLLTQLFSKSYLVKNDAPLSVRRGLIKKEWQQLFAEAGIQPFTIQWQWAFRYLITCMHD